jgi:hypothetical protein
MTKRNVERPFTDDERLRLFDETRARNEAALAAIDNFSREAQRAISGRRITDFYPRAQADRPAG